MKLVIVCLMLLATIPAAAQDIFPLDGVTDCGTPTAGVSRTLSAGTHYFTLYGAVSNWSGDGANGGNAWMTYVNVYNTSTGLADTFYNPSLHQPTAALAEAEVAGMIFSFDLAAATTVWFYISDSPCGDNRGTVFVSLDDPVVAVDVSSWGSLKGIYR